MALLRQASQALRSRGRVTLSAARSLHRAAVVTAKDDVDPPGGEQSDMGATARRAGGSLARLVGGVLGVGAAVMAGMYAYGEYGEDPNKANERVQGGRFGPRGRKPRKASLVLAFLNQECFTINEHGVAKVESAWINANDPMEDRHSLHDLGPHGLLVGMFDGHSGFGTSDVLSHYLATYTLKELEALPEDARTDRSRLATALRDSFVNFDHDLTEKVPTGAMESGSRDLLRAFVPAALSGAVACAALLHPTGIYVANTGDCRVVLGSVMPDGSYGSTPLSHDQTGETPSEVERIKKEHPGEEDTCVRNGRVLGGLQPSRAFGDSRYKWSLERMERLGVRAPGRSRTPPYVTAEPEVVIHAPHATDRFIILATDGLWDVVSSERAVNIAGEAISQGIGAAEAASRLVEAALQVYANDATNGDVQALLGLQKARNYRDDVTATVVILRAASPYAESDMKDNIPKARAETLVDLLEKAKLTASPTAEAVAAAGGPSPAEGA